jgi:hypothetical protein
MFVGSTVGLAFAIGVLARAGHPPLGARRFAPFECPSGESAACSIAVKQATLHGKLLDPVRDYYKSRLPQHGLSVRSPLEVGS